MLYVPNSSKFINGVVVVVFAETVVVVIVVLIVVVVVLIVVDIVVLVIIVAVVVFIVAVGVLVVKNEPLCMGVDVVKTLICEVWLMLNSIVPFKLEFF